MHDMSAHAHVEHHAPTGFLRKHVFSLDHKVIGKQYYGLALVAVLVGMVLSWLMRLHLGWTNLAIPGLHVLTKNGAPGDVMTPEFYLQLMTMHATIMVFFVLTTAPFAAFGNYFLPIQGARHERQVLHEDLLLEGAAAERMGLVYYLVHGPDGIRRVDARLHTSDSRSCCRD